MAKKIDAGRFLVIECTAAELMDAVGSYECICDWCDKTQPHNGKGYYIAVLNHWYCEECYKQWISRATYYPEDADVERRNFEFYAPRFGLKCQ